MGHGPCHVRYVRTAGGPRVRPTGQTDHVIIVAHVLLKLTLSSDSHQLQCMKLQHFKLDIFKSI